MSNTDEQISRLIKKIKLNLEYRMLGNSNQGVYYTPYIPNIPNIFLFNERSITKKKYVFSRAKWHIAEFNDSDYHEVDKWCANQFGKHDKYPNAWSRWWHKYESSIHFRDEKDYLMFLLRWGA